MSSITEELIENMVKTNFNEACEKVCKPDYYKNIFLEYAMRNHTSVICIGRTFAEMQKSYYQHFSKDPVDLKQVNQTINYLNIYSDKARLIFISDLLQKLLLTIMTDSDYLILKFDGRFKSFLSHYVKTITKIIMNETLLSVSDQIQKFFKGEELDIARNLIQELFQINNKKNPSKDVIGCRLVVDAHNYSTDEDLLIDYIYHLFSVCENFFYEYGFDITEVKDYIESPKCNGYQSLHFSVDVMGLPIELQLRTNKMDYEAENGSASHTEYKNTVLHNYIKNFMYDISESTNRTLLNEHIGLLIHQSIPMSSVCKTPHSEVPETPAMLKEFENLQLLKQIFKRSQKN